jgi:hypothetical protein
LKSNLKQIEACIKSFQFEELFIEVLGWDRHKSTLNIAADDREFVLTGFAEKRGFQIFVCRVLDDQEFPTSQLCKKVQRIAAKSAHENIIVFVDDSNTRQSWKWAKRELGKSLIKSRGFDFLKGTSPQALAQRLSKMAFGLHEEQTLTLVDVNKKVKSALDIEKITKAFYKQFEQEHRSFLNFIEGIKDVADREWYASLMLNRLMFVYFIQQKGFLSGETDYLRKRLNAVQTDKGKDKFYRFYRHFLLRLFHEGFGQREKDRPNELDELIGTVPYLNGGLFDVHELERDYPKIKVKDEAFERLFEFFDKWKWHLDDRPLHDNNQINPDVLGYIFEQYINNKQMGAYYTKEDITDYISKNSIIPYLFDAVKQRSPDAFHSDGDIWAMMSDNPNKYIYDAVGHGIFVEMKFTTDGTPIDEERKILDEEHSLPKNISAGIKNISKRGDWNKAAPENMALPTETWRELLARRQRYKNVVKKMAASELTSINDLITYNLNITQFAEDVIGGAGPVLLRSFYYTIAGRIPHKSNETFQQGISVLDPTCGSGAFLFAALKILQPLYDACIDRMEEVLNSAEVPTPEPIEYVEKIIELDESDTREFKSTARWDVRNESKSKEMEHEILKTVAAFLNTKGGDLLIGIDDSGKTVGLELDYETFSKKKNQDGFYLWLKDKLSTTFGTLTVVENIFTVFTKRDGRDICRVTVEPSKIGHRIKKTKLEDVYYVRVGNASSSLTDDEVAEYQERRSNSELVVREDITLAKSGTLRTKNKHQDFQRVLDDVNKHPSRGYFILKSIIINNLFGVDIMPEAVEICKLRLFLKLVSETSELEHLEPLPDIDFNIRVGNTLVGFTSMAHIRESVSKDRRGNSTFVFPETEEQLVDIEEQLLSVKSLFQVFRRQQTVLGGAVLSEDKEALNRSLSSLTAILDEFMASDYEIDPTKKKKFQEWRKSHLPFHWFAEFYANMESGGFDTIIGNPPYVEYSKVKRSYTVKNYKTESCGNLYAYCWERVLQLVQQHGRSGMIVPVASVCTDGYRPLQTELLRNSSLIVSNFNDRPSKLFDGLEHIRLSIILHANNTSQHRTYSTGYNKWQAVERPNLFSQLRFVETTKVNVDGAFAKVGSDIELSLIRQFRSTGTSIVDKLTPTGKLLYYTRKLSHFVQILDFIPEIKDGNGNKREPSELKSIAFADTATRDKYLAMLNSSLFYWLITAFSDCRNLNKREIFSARVPTNLLDNERGAELARLSRTLMKDIRHHSQVIEMNYKKHGTLKIQCTYPKFSKQVIDEIDRALALGFSFSEEEVDFIVNFDYKYRIGIHE